MGCTMSACSSLGTAAIPEPPLPNRSAYSPGAAEVHVVFHLPSLVTRLTVIFTLFSFPHVSTSL